MRTSRCMTCVVKNTMARSFFGKYNTGLLSPSISSKASIVSPRTAPPARIDHLSGEGLMLISGFNLFDLLSTFLLA